MDICDLGCGQQAHYTQKNGRRVCSDHHIKCPAVRQKAGERSGKTRKGLKLSQEHRKNIGKGNLGRVVSPETRKKISESICRQKAKNPQVAWNKGKKLHYDVWNKGKRKRETMPVLPGDDPAYSDFRKYRNRVAVRTGKTYQEYKNEINPLDLTLGKSGIEGAHQIDHIISVREGFDKQIPVEIIAGKENLQILPWLDNIRKYDGTRKISDDGATTP